MVFRKNAFNEILEHGKNLLLKLNFWYLYHFTSGRLLNVTALFFDWTFMGIYVWYCRVSTKEQGMSGLWIAAQQQSIENYVNAIGGSLHAQVFTEVESGKNNQRPELWKAIEICKKMNATLLIAKIDRLSRNLTFISSLMDSQVKFKAVDMPEADNFTIHIFAALAQKERELISERTKAALAQRKVQGYQLWTPENLTSEAIEKGRRIRMENALSDWNNRRASSLILLYRKEEMSFACIAEKLNENGYQTRKWKLFSPMTLKRLFDRYRPALIS